MKNKSAFWSMFTSRNKMFFHTYTVSLYVSTYFKFFLWNLRRESILKELYGNLLISVQLNFNFFCSVYILDYLHKHKCPTQPSLNVPTQNLLTNTLKQFRRVKLRIFWKIISIFRAVQIHNLSLYILPKPKRH